MSIDDEILECEAQIRRAQLTSDVQALERLLDDQLMFTSLDGTIATKADDLALHRSGRLRVTRMEPLEYRILHLGATAVVSVKMDAAAVIDGAEIANILRYTRVWHKRSDRWQIAAGHLSAVPA